MRERERESHRVGQAEVGERRGREQGEGRSEHSESSCKGIGIGRTWPPLGTRCVLQSLVEVGWALIPYWVLVTESMAEWLHPEPPCDPFLTVPAGLHTEQGQCWSGSQGLAVSMCPSAVPAASAVNGGRLAGRQKGLLECRWVAPKILRALRLRLLLTVSKGAGLSLERGWPSPAVAPPRPGQSPPALGTVTPRAAGLPSLRPHQAGVADEGLGSAGAFHLEESH